MGFLGDLSGSTSVSGGRSSSAQQANSYSQSYSQTDAAAARAFSAEQADLAYKRQKELIRMEQAYNTAEAQKSRDWQTEMANTIYTRSINNMKEAGINPILAASMGLSGASVGSGATASISGAYAPMAQSFMDTSSASSGGSQSYGESNGSQWGSSESGLAVGLQAMGQAIGEAISTMQSGNTINYMMEGLGKQAKTTWNDIKELMIDNLPNSIVNMLGITADKSGSGSTMRKKTITGNAKIGGKKR